MQNMSPGFGTGNLFRAFNVYLIFGTLTISITKSDEIESNTAVVRFSDITITAWNIDNKTTKLKNIMGSVANGYCSSYFDKCALRFWNTTRVFKGSDIKIPSSYPKQVENDVEIQFYVNLPTGNDIRKNGSKVLPKSVLNSLLEANSTQISSAVNVQIKTKVDDSTQKPTADNTLDKIMIPVSFGLLIFVIVLACCLHFCHKRKIEAITREERRQFVLKQNTERSKPQSPFQVPGKKIPEVAVKPQKRDEPQLYYEDEQAVIHAGQKQDMPMEQENTSQPIKKEKHKKHRERISNDVDGSYLNEECEDNMEEKDEEPVDDESDYERRRSKRKNKKKRHRKRGDFPRHENNLESNSDGDVKDAHQNNMEADISSRLPPPRKLPPLRKNNAAFDD